MGMVVSAAVSGIPLIEELESARPAHPTAKKGVGGKSGARKPAASTAGPATQNLKNQPKDKPKPGPLNEVKGGLKKVNKPNINSKAGVPDKAKSKGQIGGNKIDTKATKSQDNNSGKPTNKGAGRGASTASRGGGPSAGRGGSTTASGRGGSTRGGRGRR